MRVARAVRDASSCEGLNLVQSNRKVGQQDVFHFHLHISPRFDGDEVVLSWDNYAGLSRGAELLRSGDLGAVIKPDEQPFC